MDPLKEAFQKIKEDIFSLKNDFYNMNNEIKEIKDYIQEIKTQEKEVVQTQSIHKLSQNNIDIPTSDIQTDNQTVKQGENINSYTYNQTIQTDIPSKEPCQTDIQTDNDNNSPKKTHPKPLCSQKSTFSIGNDGVQTDKPTDQSTDSCSVFQDKKADISQISSLNNTISEFERVNEILSSLDDVKKEIRNKFKSLTSQEMLVFSTLYTLEDQGIEEVGYQILAKSLNLTESSIRDYINKLIKKGIPIDKTRLNNKKIILKVSENLKKIATLATISKLRDI
jgi:DNA-binding MarR family transcriptional regulator